MSMHTRTYALVWFSLTKTEMKMGQNENIIISFTKIEVETKKLIGLKRIWNENCEMKMNLK